MQLIESSIYINLKRLRKRLYGAQFMMTKSARIIYGTPLMNEVGKTIAFFTLAFTIREKRVEYIERAIGHFSVLRTDLEFIAAENIIHFPKRETEDESADPREKISTLKVELFKLVSDIDREMCKWRSSMNKGKPVCA